MLCSVFWEEVMAREEGPVVRLKTVEATKLHQASTVSTLQVLASPKGLYAGYPRGLGVLATFMVVCFKMEYWYFWV